MSKQELNTHKFRQLLIAQRDALAEIASTSAQSAETVELDQQRVGRLSRMDAIAQQAMGQESERRRVLQIRRIDAALKRVEDGDYGYCLTCDELIAAPRLEVDPAATQCIECAQKAE